MTTSLDDFGQSAEENSANNEVLTYTAMDEEEEVKSTDKDFDKVNLKDQDAGVIREVTGGIEVPIQHFPEEINVKRNIKNKEDEKKRSLNISKVGPLTLDLKLKYTSITQNEKGDDEYTTLPREASDLFQRLTLPLRPPKTLSGYKSIPKVVEFQIPVLTVRFKRDTITNYSDINSKKEAKKKEKELSRERKQEIETVEGLTNLAFIIGGPDIPGGGGTSNLGRSLIKGTSEVVGSVYQFFTDEPKKVIESVDDARVNMGTSRFTGWISAYKEERRKFSNNQEHNELIASLEIQEILPDKLIEITKQLQKVNTGDAGAVRQRTIGKETWEHGARIRKFEQN